MNIFEIHGLTTSRIEPLHSTYLADCLKSSPELLRKFWTLATRSVEGWSLPQDVNVIREDMLEEGKRVDIVLKASDCLIAVEAKTTDSSVKPGQLDEYVTRLRRKYSDQKIWMVYLTPFNAENKPSGSRGHEAIKEFGKFHCQHPFSSHLSWAQVVRLVWEGQDEVWQQHGEYVIGVICKPPPETVGWGSLDEDLGWETMRDFWEEVNRARFDADQGTIKLKSVNDSEALANALKLLLMNERVRRQSKVVRSFPAALRRPFIDSNYSKFHERIFRLLEDFPFLGIRGRSGYGLLLPLRGRHRVVSICTSKPEQPQLLVIGRKPE